MYRALLLSTLILFSAQQSSASDSLQRLEGIILDAETHEPIPGANIITGENGGTADSLGYFSFYSEPGESLLITHIGYNSQQQAVSGSFLQIFLVPRILESPELVVRSGYYSDKLINQDASITVMDGRELEQSKVLHFQGILDRIPNLNYAGGTSRPRYFQIRGIGERSQYAGEGSPVFSVGFIFDDYDMTGISMTSFLFGIDQIEIYRGPQSSVFGPSAIGGLIYMHSRKSPEQFEMTGQLSLGSYGLLQKAISIGNQYYNGLYAHRITVLSNNHRGFRENIYLGRNDLNGKDEVMIYYKSKLQFSPNLKSRFSILYSDARNGYDAWSPDNERISYADQPGVDKQLLRGISAHTVWTPNQDNTVKISGAQTQSKMVYSYDSDWANNSFWAGDPYNFDPEVEGWEYSFFDQTNRDRLTQQLEIKWNINPHEKNYDVTAGIFFKNLTERDSATGWLFGGDDFELMSDFDIQVRSGYFQFRHDIGQKLTALLNIRGEYRTTDYADDNNIKYFLKDKLLGWKASLDYELTGASKIYLASARGYKGGGVNQHPRLSADNRPYGAETLDNFEAGYRNQGLQHFFSATIFYGERHNQQVSLSRQQDENDPNSFVYFTSNATTGYQTGIELEGDFLPTQKIKLSGSLGLLKTHVAAYSFKVDSATVLELGNRGVAHAPAYSFRVGVEYEINDYLDCSVNVHGKDKFFYSDSHNQMSQAYSLVDMDLSYQWKRYSVSLWSKNALNTEYGIRGFYFGLEPPLFPDKLYTQLGDPRQVGITFKYDY